MSTETTLTSLPLNRRDNDSVCHYVAHCVHARRFIVTFKKMTFQEPRPLSHAHALTRNVRLAKIIYNSAVQGRFLLKCFAGDG